jgi:hypothetical protein
VRLCLLTLHLPQTLCFTSYPQFLLVTRKLWRSSSVQQWLHFNLLAYPDATILQTSSCYQTSTTATFQTLTNEPNKPLDLVHFSLEDMSKRVWKTSQFFYNVFHIQFLTRASNTLNTCHLWFYCDISLHVYEGTRFTLTAKHCVKRTCCVTLFVVCYAAETELYTNKSFLLSTSQ